MFDASALGTFGHLPDPPKKPGETPDRSFSAGLLPKLTAVAAGDVDLRPYTTQTNQYSASSCVGNATADSVEILNAIAGLPAVQLSRLFVYTLARNMVDADLDGRGDIDKDNGTFIRLAFDVLNKFGICREDLAVEDGGWPYDLTKLSTLPSLKSMRAATAHRIHSYYRIEEDGDARIEGVLAALRANHPVVFGTTLEQSFLHVSDGTPVGPPAGATIGNHAMIVVGYIEGKGFIIKNSWGPDWGVNGCCFMTPDYLAWPLTSDMWVPTKGSMFA